MSLSVSRLLRFGAFSWVFCLAVLYSPLAAQTFFGSVVGTVTDSSGAAVPEANVTLTNTGTDEHRTAATDGNGNYQFVNLVPGTYRVELEKKGFSHLTLDEVQVRVQASLRLNATMQVGQLTQTLEVSAEAPLLQTEQASLSQAVEGRTVEEMPLNGRNVLNLVGLVPGVVPQGSTAGNPMGNQSGGATTNPNGWGNYQIGGGQANQSASYFDGAPLNVSYVNSVILVPTQDAVQEFRVATNSVSPEFGRFAGGVVNLASKSGTNQFHGSLYEYFRNTVLNANNFFNNRSGSPRPAFNQNQFGVEASGPAIKDKTFFMFSWEDFKLRIGVPTISTLPTAAMRAGDFSAKGIPVIYDPLTVCGNYGNAACAKDASGNAIYVRQPFPGNQIPASRIDSTAKVMNGMIGSPNEPGILNNFVLNGTGGGDNYQINTRGDQVISDKQRVFARYTRWLGNTIPNDIFHNNTSGTQQRYSTNNAVIGDTYTLSPRMVLDVRASYIRFLFGFYPVTTGKDLSIFGPAFATLQNQMSFRVYPGPGVSGFTGAGGGIVVRNASNNETLSETLTYIIGRHQLKVGAESRKIEWNYAQVNNPSTSYSFTTAFTALNPQSPIGSGYAEASFLLGDAASGAATETVIASQRQWYHGAFVSDVFQVTPKFTVNLGMRWEYPGSFSERHDAATVLLPNTADPLGTTVGLPLQGLVALVNSPQYPSRLIHPPVWNLVAPRLGLAYRLNDKTVVRSGYGLSFLPNDVVFGNAPWDSPAVLSSTAMVSTLDGGITPFNVLSNPFPNGLVQPPGHSSAFASSLIGSTVQSPVPNEPNPYVQQWNFTIQRQLPSSMALEVGYAGSKGTHMPLDLVVGGFPYFQVNQLSDQYLSLGNALLAQVKNPFYGHVPSTAGILAQPTVAQGQLLRPLPQYQGVNNTSDMYGDSIYHSLQTKLEKRFKGGGVLLAAYTVAKLIGDTDTSTSWLETNGAGTFQDYNNVRLERSVTSYDVPQRAAISYVTDLPVGKGKRLLSGVHGIADKVISGWGLSGTTTFQSGFPMVLTAQPTTLSGTFGGGAPRPNVVGGCQEQIAGRPQDRLNEFFNVACFTQPGPFAFGNEPRTDPRLRNMGINNWDLALSKNTIIHENWRLRFETEFFNLANRTQFAQPNTQLGSTTFGIVTATRNQPRLVQFALRLVF